MKILILIIVTSFLISCSNTDKKIYTLPSNKDINEIIETIILSDSIPVLISNAVPDTIHYKDRPDLVRLPIKFPFSIDLKKLRISFPEPNNDGVPPPPPPHGSGVYFNSLISRGLVDEINTFTKADSAYFSFQNDTLKHFTINSGIVNRIYTTTSQKQENKEDTYFVCSIPVFSTDKEKAYVELTYRCYGLCSYANSYILKKTNNRWAIIKKQTLWFS